MDIITLAMAMKGNGGSGTVKSVNNVEPDESGNVNIEIQGEAVQPDWNQNDSSEPDYVKNRPFYIGEASENAIF